MKSVSSLFAKVPRIHLGLTLNGGSRLRSANDKFVICSSLSRKIGFNISSESSAWQVIHMKYQTIIGFLYKRKNLKMSLKISDGSLKITHGRQMQLPHTIILVQMHRPFSKKSGLA